MEGDTVGRALAEQALAEAPEVAPQVQEVLEGMLSKRNLVVDQFLAGNMNPQMYIPIHTLLEHEKLQTISATEEQVIEAAKRSTKLGIDDAGTMVRPLLKSRRNVIILRDIPDETTEAEIRELFVGCPHESRISSIKPEVNNTWFVKFKLDDGTQDVVLWLRTRLFKGKVVNAAIKSEHFLRSFFPLPAPNMFPPNMNMMGMDFMGQAMYQPPMDGGQVPPGGELEGMASSWADVPDPGGGTCGGKGCGVAPMPGMPTPQGMMMGLGLGPQMPGFWQPWGARSQPPPLVFVSATELASSSILPVASQAAHMAPDVIDNLGGDGGGGRSKWGKGGWNKGKWDSGGKDKGWDSGGKDKGWDSGGKDKGWGKSRWGSNDSWWATDSEPNYKGRDWGNKGGGKGRGGGWKEEDPAWGGDTEGKGKYSGGSAKGKWAPAPRGTPAGPPRCLGLGATFRHDFRKYGRDKFEELSKAVGGESLEKPGSQKELEADMPIFREAPCAEFAPVVSSH